MVVTDKTSLLSPSDPPRKLLFSMSDLVWSCECGEFSIAIMAAAGSVVGICGLDLTLHPRTQQPVVVYNFDLFSEKLGREIFLINCNAVCISTVVRRGGLGLDLTLKGAWRKRVICSN